MGEVTSEKRNICKYLISHGGKVGHLIEDLLATLHGAVYPAQEGHHGTVHLPSEHCNNTQTNNTLLN